MVARAIAYCDEMGTEAALARFNAAPAPEFLDRGLYIFCLRAGRRHRGPRRRLLVSGEDVFELHGCRRHVIRRGDAADDLGGRDPGRLQVDQPGHWGGRTEVELARVARRRPLRRGHLQALTRCCERGLEDAGRSCCAVCGAAMRMRHRCPASSPWRRGVVRASVARCSWCLQRPECGARPREGGRVTLLSNERAAGPRVYATLPPEVRAGCCRGGCRPRQSGTRPSRRSRSSRGT